MEVVSSFKYFGSDFSKNGGPQNYVKIKFCEGIKTFCAMKIMVRVKSVRLEVK